jgi:hypothetical protein
MGKVYRGFNLLLATILLVFLTGTGVQAAPTAAEITGEIENLTLNDPTDVYSGGVMIVGGSQVILPKNLLIDLPANRLTLWQIYDQAPALCKASGESGLAKGDKCNASGTGGFATFSGVHSTAGNIIAGDVLIEKGKEVVSGAISYINYTDGYFRVNGTPNDSATGSMVRLNDPTSRHSVQQGLGCAGGPNCSPDPRFTLDPDNYVNTFSSGYPFCIPSTVPRNFPGLPAVSGISAIAPQATFASAGGAGDLLCPASNRTPGVVVEPDVSDSRLFAPLMVGDSVNAEGNFEMVNGVRFLSAHTTRVNKALSTRNSPDQPDYMFLEEVFIEAPGFQNQRARMLIIGFTTLAPTDVDFWTIHRDPATNAIHEFPLASIQGCDISQGANKKVGGVPVGGVGVFPNGSCSSQGLIGAGANIFRIRYDVDFLLAASNNPPGGADAKLSPCLQLMASPRFALSNPGICAGGATLANNFGIMSPIPHEIQARTGHSLDNPGLNTKTLDINGRQATNGQYLFPFGMNLGGIETADFLEIDINLLNTPRVFEGIPWNHDRRLSPSGCLKNGGVCEPLDTSPMGTFALDPFPFTGLDPRLQAQFLVAGLPGGTPKNTYSDPNFTNTPLTNASNRVFSFVSGAPFASGKFNFDGDNTLLPCATGSCPPDPGLITINPTPVLNIFGPVAVDDTAVTRKGVAVTFNVAANDVPVLGFIDPATVKIVSPASNGSVAPTPFFPGAFTYTPTATFTGTDTFTYTIANNFGAVSNTATVTITVASPPLANPDTAITTTVLPIPINVIANDTPGTSPINTASVIVAGTPTCGTVTNQLNGTLLFNPPTSAPSTGTCTFNYTVSDSATPPQTSLPALVTVAVSAANVAPVAMPDLSARTTVNTQLAIDVVANDVPGTSAINPASVAPGAPSGGTISLDPVTQPGKVLFTAPAAGTYTFNYSVNDINGLTSNPAGVNVTVTAPPVANADGPIALPNGVAASINFSVIGNDTAGAGPGGPFAINPSSVVIVTPPQNGAAVANLNGTVTYTPNPGYIGPDSFTYTIRDSLGVASVNPATVTMDVQAPPQETITITVAQFIVNGSEWRVEGTTTARGGQIIVANSATFDGNNAVGQAVPVDPNGGWKLSVKPGLIPTGTQISVWSSATTNVLEGITLVVR